MATVLQRFHFRVPFRATLSLLLCNSLQCADMQVDMAGIVLKPRVRVNCVQHKHALSRVTLEKSHEQIKQVWRDTLTAPTITGMCLALRAHVLDKLANARELQQSVLWIPGRGFEERRLPRENHEHDHPERPRVCLEQIYHTSGVRLWSCIRLVHRCWSGLRTVGVADKHGMSEISDVKCAVTPCKDVFECYIQVRNAAAVDECDASKDVADDRASGLLGGKAR
ncbi:hypothetical protein FI667_g3095, partial [Globisporangium splendens]